MDARDFTRRLKKIKAELLALKQSHKYGLNRTNFYYASKDEPIVSSGKTNIRITITFNMREIEMPFYTMYSPLDDSSSEYGASLWDSVNKRLILTGNCYNYSWDTKYSVYIASEREIAEIKIEEI